jgi:DNA invertase Pin-like site-specific DNA recombinase
LTVPSGEQPQENGRLRCLECGQWYKLLAPHLARAHGMSTGDYRQAHRLPRKLSLRAADLNERAREQGLARYAERPDIRAHMAAGRQAVDRANTAAGTRASAEFAMVRAARRRGGQGNKAAARRSIDQRAQKLGYDSVETYFAARPGAPIARMAAELGVARSTVSNWLRQQPQRDALADLVGHLLAVVRGEEGNPQAAVWRAQIPDLARLEQELGAVRSADTVLAEIPDSRAARQAAYLAALVTHGGDRQQAARAAGMLPKSIAAWREKPGWRLAENAVEAVARDTPVRPRVADRETPLTDEEKAAFLDGLRQAVPVKQAARAAGRSLYAFRELRRADPVFATAWDEARVLRGHPRARLDENELRRLYALALPVTDIADQLGVSGHVVTTRIRALDLKRPRIKRRKRTPGDRENGTA